MSGSSMRTIAGTASCTGRISSAELQTGNANEATGTGGLVFRRECCLDEPGGVALVGLSQPVSYTHLTLPTIYSV